MSTINDLKYLEKKRSALIAELLEVRYMLRGSFGVSYRSCGKSTCWCATEEKGHPYNRIAWTKDAQGFTKVIAQEEIAWIKEVTDAYRRFRKLRQKLRKLNDDQRFLLNKLEDDLVEKTKKLRDYL